MKNESSYNISKVSINMQKEIDRLKGQVDLFWMEEQKLYQSLGIKDGMSILEVGSGPGFLIEKLSELYPNSSISGIEIDQDLVNYSQQYLKEKGKQNCIVKQGSIMDLEAFSQTKADIVIARLVLEHLSNPNQALYELAKVLHTGGKLIVLDNDFGMHIMAYPDIPELNILYEAYSTARQIEGGNPKIGRQLPVLLKDTGFEDVQYLVVCAHSGVVGEELFFSSEGIGIPLKLVNDGLITSNILADIAKKWKVMLETEEHSVIRQIYAAVGTKGVNYEKS